MLDRERGGIPNWLLDDSSYLWRKRMPSIRLRSEEGGTRGTRASRLRPAAQHFSPLLSRPVLCVHRVLRASCKLRVRARREAQGAGCREQGDQGHKGVYAARRRNGVGTFPLKA